MNIIITLQFMLAKGVGDVTLKKFFSFITTNGLDLCDGNSFLGDFYNYYKIKDYISNEITNSYNMAKETADNLLRSNIECITEIDDVYPIRLKQILGKRCPPVIFVKGNKKLLSSTAVGFCGSRRVSARGMDIAADCTRQLVENNITIVSGYAKGTDMTAHTTALKNGGNTVFVLAEGLLRSKLKSDVFSLLNTSNHIFVSQFAPNIGWNVGNAMKRNSIIIGLSNAVILVESGRTGGTFAAGNETLRVGSPLFVIDFAQPEVSAEANPYFISSGGRPIRGKCGKPNLADVFNLIGTDSSDLNYSPPQPQFTYKQTSLAM